MSETSNTSNDAGFVPDEEGTRVLFERTAPLGPPTDVDSLLAPMAHTPATISVPPGHGESLFRLTTLASLASVMALLVFGLLVLWPENSVAFGAVKQAVDGVKSVQYTMIDTISKESPAAQAEEQPKRFLYEGDDGNMEFRELTDEGLRKPSGSFPFPRYTRVMILGKHLKRDERPGDHGKFSIQDMQGGRLITVDSLAKTFTVMSRQLVMNAVSGEVIEDRVIAPKPRPEIDFYKDIREIPEEAMQLIGEALIDGRLARGFKRVEKTELDTWTRVYWVDSETNLPVRIEVSLRSLHPRRTDANSVLTDFVFDEPLDPALFPVEPPQGYELKEGRMMGLEFVSPAKKSESVKE